MPLTIPQSVLDRPEGTAGPRTPFPKGLWFFELGDVREKDTPDFMANHKPGKRAEVAEAGVQLGVQLESAQAAEEGQEAAGNQKHFLDLIVQDGSYGVLDVDVTAKQPAYGFGIQRDARMVARLARALGQTVETPAGVQVSADFIEQLKGGAFKSQRILVRVDWEEFTKRDGTPGAKAITTEILPA